MDLHLERTSSVHLRQHRHSTGCEKDGMSLPPFGSASGASPGFIAPATLNSPVSDLTFNLGELHCYGNTPKRRLSLSSNTPTPRLKPLSLEKQVSVDDGCCMDSPSPLDDSPFIEARFGSTSCKQANERSPLEVRSAAYRRFQSMPIPFCGFEPSPSPPATTSSRLSLEQEQSPDKCRITLNLEDENSQDSGVGLEKDKDLDDFVFPLPKGPAPRRSRVLNDETNSPTHFSPCLVRTQRSGSTPNAVLHFPGSDNLLAEKHERIFSPSPVKLRKSSLTCSPENEDGDDGFLDVMDLEDEHKGDENVPKGMQMLFSAPLVSEQTTPSKSRKVRSRVRIEEPLEGKPRFMLTAGSRRGLFRSPSTPRLFSEKSQSFDARPKPTQVKREPCREDEMTPKVCKRRKSTIEMKSPECEDIVCNPKTLVRSHSEAMIKSALNRNDEQPDLIGDFSKPYCLPLVPGKHQDLKSISADTMADVLNGKYDDTVEKYVIVDCRYPYEFVGGHIRGAKNLYIKEENLTEFINSTEYHQPSDSHKRTIIIYHCEFSSERGPNMSRFLRKHDRQTNKDVYPSLYFPEMYVLDQGYKAFYESHKELCDPHTYKPMLHEDHMDDLKHFRLKSKSWAGEKRSSYRHGLKV